MSSSTTISLHPGSRWDKAAARLGPAGRNDFEFLAAIAETDAAGDGKLAERLGVLAKANEAHRLAAARN